MKNRRRKISPPAAVSFISVEKTPTSSGGE